MTSRPIIPLIFLALYSLTACKTGGSQKEAALSKTVRYESSWESLKQHQTPEWLLDAKFGIYAHWGVYSVPAYGNEWYAKRMYDKTTDVYRHHVETYGDPSQFGYKEFIPMFRAEQYDPDEWAEMIAGSGARYAGFAVVHHDGFCLWDSEHTRWNSMDMGPKRDLYGELVNSLRKKENMKIVATFHHIRTFNWYLPYKPQFYNPVDEELRREYLSNGWDIFDPEYGDLYWNQETGEEEDFIREWNSKVKEVIAKYQPDVIWFDGGQFQDSVNERMVTELLSHYYNKEKEWNKELEILNKLPVSMKLNFPDGVGLKTYEEGRDRKTFVKGAWVDDMKISDFSWGYILGQTYKDPGVIIDGLIDRVSRGGGLLLSLCPKADGTIGQEQKEILREMGTWLGINGEAIYGTRPWKIHAEGNDDKLITKGEHPKWVFDRCNEEDIRFTRKGNVLYALVLGIPTQKEILIETLGSVTEISTKGIKKILLLGSDDEIGWERTEQGLTLSIPSDIPSDYALAFRIEINGEWVE